MAVASQNAPSQQPTVTKTQNATAAKAAPKPEPGAQTKAEQASKAETKPASQAGPKPEAKPATSAESKPAPKPESKPASSESAEPAKGDVFVFNYQVAALASMDQAQAFLKQIEPGGFKSSVVTATHEGKTWYRIYVHHQGTVESAMALKEKLKASGITGVLLRSRTPL